MRDAVRRMAEDLRAIRRAYEADVAARVIERGLDETSGESEFERILGALADRGVISDEEADAAWDKIKERATAW